jgi:hypothetical protein
MKKTCVSATVLLLFVSTVFAAPAAAGSPLEEGEITGTIEKTNNAFLRDYEKLDYGSKKEWQDWGKALKSVGWIVVRGDSAELKDYLLLVINTRTEMESNDSEKCQVMDLAPGTRIEARYKMGWDALHAIYVKKLDE